MTLLRGPVARLSAAYRATGADGPFGDPLPAHGVAMEGYFWRFTLPDRAVIALLGVNRGPDGAWGTAGLAASTPGFVRTVALPDAVARRDRVGVTATGPGLRFDGDERHVRVDLGPDARLDATLHDLVAWPRRRWGGSSAFQLVPGLNQYWHPWLLGGRATGTATVAGEVIDLAGAQVYAEKNWGREGFPDHWWWGQAQGFADAGACVAFAGGEVTAGPLRTTVTALVVRLPDGRLVRLGDPVVSPVRTDTTDTTWTLRGRGFGWQVEVDADAPLSASHVLPVPLPREGRNTAGAIEHLAGHLTVRVSHHGHEVWSGESAVAALEHGGLARAGAELRRRGAPPHAVDAAPAEGMDPPHTPTGAA